MSRAWWRRIGALALAAAAWGCGASDGGIGGTGLVPVSAQGAIIALEDAVGAPAKAVARLTVNDRRFETAGARVILRGRAGNASDLALGMTVQVEGFARPDGSAFATAIRFEETLRGPIERIERDRGFLAVFGQIVLYDAETVFAGAAIEALEVGNVVEVSGAQVDAGAIVASRVQFLAEQLDPMFEFTASGPIREVSLAAERFGLGDLVVDFSEADFVGLPAAALTEGTAVRVRGRFDSVGRVLAATLVESRAAPPFEPGAVAEIAGFVTRVGGPASFVVDFSVAVRIVETTEFDPPVPGALVRNAFVVVEGRFARDGSVVAERIAVRRAPPVLPQSETGR